MRPLRLRLFALLATVALLLPGGALAKSAYFCRLMDRVGPTCCCEEARTEHARHATGPELRGTGCCERLTVPDRATAANPNDTGLDVGATPLSALIPVPLHDVSSARVGAVPPPQARAPPAVGPPLFLAHCAFLS